MNEENLSTIMEHYQAQIIKNEELHVEIADKEETIKELESRITDLENCLHEIIHMAKNVR